MFYLIARITILGLRFLLLFLCNNVTLCRAHLNHPWQSKISQLTGPSKRHVGGGQENVQLFGYLSWPCQPQKAMAFVTGDGMNDIFFVRTVWPFGTSTSMSHSGYQHSINSITNVYVYYILLHIKFWSVQNIDNWVDKLETRKI